MIARTLLVAAGGALGTALRLALELLLPEPGGFPLAVFAANVLGSFAIGMVMGRMPQATGIRFFLAPGVLGGFTTYSAFAVGTLELWRDVPALAAGYAAASLVLGVAACVLGLRLATPRDARGRRAR